jgi:glucose-6-phosphate-specific signal transduction histidine kinase
MAPADFNPYASPAAADSVEVDARRAALARLRGPSLGLLLLAGMWSVGLIHSLIVIVLLLSGTHEISQVHVIQSLCVLPSCFIVYGAWCMRRGRRYRLALAAAVLASIPVLSPCIWMGIPFGVWALVVLRRPGVRAAFS